MHALELLPLCQSDDQSKGKQLQYLRHEKAWSTGHYLLTNKPQLAPFVPHLTLCIPAWYKNSRCHSDSWIMIWICFRNREIKLLDRTLIQLSTFDATAEIAKWIQLFSNNEKKWNNYPDYNIAQNRQTQPAEYLLIAISMSMCICIWRINHHNIETNNMFSQQLKILQIAIRCWHVKKMTFHMLLDFTMPSWKT